jgi:drug/metabolite transporter (DMT)-like permease
MNGTLSNFLQPLTNISFIIAILYLGVLSSLGTSLMTNYILSKIEASKMSVFSNLGTVITIIAGAVFLKEKIYLYHIIGSILIVGGVLGANFLDKKHA